MENGKCLVARVIVGGMIHRQKLLNVGDEIFEINSISVRYKDIQELQMMLRSLFLIDTNLCVKLSRDLG